MEMQVVRVVEKQGYGVFDYDERATRKERG